MPGGDIRPALKFATEQLGPRAPTNRKFLGDLEKTMALLMFPSDSLEPELAALLKHLHQTFFFFFSLQTSLRTISASIVLILTKDPLGLDSPSAESPAAYSRLLLLYRTVD
jgi:hypothetical protein